MRVVSVDSKGDGTIVSDGLADLVDRMLQRADMAVLGAIQRPVEDIVALEQRTAPVRTGTYRRSIHAERTITGSGVGVRIRAVGYARYIWCPPVLGPLPPGVSAGSGKPGTRWQSYLRRPALGALDELIKSDLGKALLKASKR